MRPRSLLLVLLVAGCQFGTKPQAFAPAVTPQGVAASITTRGKAHVAGELLAVEDSALLVWRDSAPMARVPLAAIEQASFAKMRVLLDAGDPMSPKDRNRLRLTSRFPQGITDDVMARLVQASGGQPVEVVR
jgi:hypothetical protein